jgi:putative transposase
MPDFRRFRVEGATYFFTVVTDRRKPFLCSDNARGILRKLLIECNDRWPFTISAIVLLPDHLHTVWILPHGDANYSRRWGWIKKEFTKAWLSAGHSEQPVSPGRVHKRQHGVFQPRFWEHLIRDEDDFERHADYIHYNPVKHGYVASPRDWEWSSFHRYVTAGAYSAEWGQDVAEPSFADIATQAGE